MKAIIDRFEGFYAVCEKEDKAMINILKINLPSEVKEGDVLIFENNKIFIDIEETKKRHKEIEKLTQGLWE